MDGIYCNGKEVVLYDGFYWKLQEFKSKWTVKRYYIQFGFVTNPNPLGEKLLHRYIYKKYAGELPSDKSHVVHHINEDEMNNTYQNLALITRGEHNKITRKNLRETNPEAFKQPPMSDERKKNLSEKMKGRKHSKEHIQKTVEARYRNALKRIEEKHNKIIEG